MNTIKGIKWVRSSSGSYDGICPYCVAHTGDPNRPTLNANPAKKCLKTGKTGVWRCCRCGKGGTLESLARKFHLGKLQNIKITAPKPKVFQGLPEESLSLVPLISTNPKSKEALTYLYNRGITTEDIEFYNLQHCLAGKYAGTIIVPVIWNQAAIYFMARSFDGSNKKLNPYADKGPAVFNLNGALTTKHRIFIVEGSLASIWVGRNTVATLGKDPTDTQLRRISSYVKNTTIMFDRGAESSAWEVARKLNYLGVQDVKVAICPGEQPDHCTKLELRHAFENATQYSPSSYFSALATYTPVNSRACTRRIF